MRRKAKVASVDAVLAALADRHRRKIVDVLKVRSHNAGDLSKLVGVSAPSMSRHLRLLKECGLVDETHPAYDARVRVYALRAAPLRELKEWLDTTEKLWTGQLASFKRHVER